MSKKICLDAGHGITTPGKRTPNDVREWTLNDAVCRQTASFLSEYDVTVIRVDNAAGTVDIPLAQRTAAVNRHSPNLFISVHHNALAGAWGTHTGVEAYSHPNKPKRDADLAKLFADEMAKLTGLRNRGAKQENFHMVRETKQTIPSVLLEGGFMDSTVDEPVITSEKGQKAYAQAVANVAVAFLGLKKITQPDTSRLLSIMGKSVATAEQMTAYLKRVNPNVPQSVLNLIPLYLSEGAEENIRGDIAFAQSCIETGNFTFSGGTAVTFEQNNFCGYGVTSLGVKGASFASRQLGIRAQIQHLKAYANTEPLKNPLVVPTVGESRFRFVERGCVPYVEWLGQKENPNGKGWAAGAGYGSKLLNILGAVLSMSVQTNKAETRTVTASFNTTKYSLNGEDLGLPTVTIDGVAYLPGAEFAKKLGLSATWDAKTNITTLTSKK